MPETRTKILYDLFFEIFATDELRKFIRLLPQGKLLASKLPGRTAAHDLVAFEAVQILQRFGVVDAELLQRLLRDYPLHEQKIRDAAARLQLELAVTVPARKGGGPRDPSPDRDDEPTTRLLLLAANPEQSPIHLDREARGIRNAIESATHREDFSYETRFAVRVDDLPRILLKTKPDIVHFAGHGVGAGGLEFANSHNEIARVSGAALKRLFEVINDDAAHGVGRPVRLVMLNACLSQVQAEAIVGAVDCVIGMSHEVRSEVATQFAATFYASLAEGRSVRSAFNWAGVDNEMLKLGQNRVPQLLERTPELARELFFTSGNG